MSIDFWAWLQTPIAPTRGAAIAATIAMLVLAVSRLRNGPASNGRL